VLEFVGLALALGLYMTKKLFITVLFAVVGLAATAHAADLNYSCDDTDVTLSVSGAKQILIENSECGVFMNQTARGPRVINFKAIEADDSDPDLCGDHATVTSSVFTGGSPITLTLNGGESSGTYRCTLDR
jgi:hypothetical protein